MCEPTSGNKPNLNSTPSEFDTTFQIRQNGVLSPSDFETIYHNSLFGSPESRSGPGSTLAQTSHIRAVLAQLIRELDIRTLLDVPCGDFHWMSHVELSHIHYIGGDIVTSMIRKNHSDHGSENIEFRVLDIVNDELPRADMILCRDCLVHLTLEDGVKAIENFKRSGARYLLSTTFPEHRGNSDEFRYWRTVDLEGEPFTLGSPVRLVREGCTEVHRGEGYGDKSLGLWDLWVGR